MSVRTLLAVLLLPLALPAQEIPRDRLDKAVRPLVDEGIVVGLAVGVVAGDATWIEGYGLLARGTEGGPGADTVYEIGSVSKVFTGVLLASLAAEGTVRLRQPVQELLPDGVTVPKVGPRAIDLLDLATHTSGLPRMPDNFAPKDMDNPYADYTADRLYAFLARCAPARGPGTAYEYSNLGAGLLGHALARRAGMSYEELLKERICAPLGMESTAVALVDGMRARLAPGHDALGNPRPNWDIPTLAGAGGIRSTVRDIVRFLQANLRDGDDPLTKACAAAREVRWKDGPAMGLGWHVAGPRHWHNGQTGGYHSFLGLDAARRHGVVVLSNTAGPAVDQLGGRLLNLLAGGEAVRREVEVAPEVLAACAGTYRFGPEFAIVFTVEKGRLMAQATGQAKFPVFPESDTTFFWKVVDAQVSFERDGDGRVVACVLHQNGADQRAPKVE